ncbi:4'-phosphopantetheinyl transferase family protein [Labrys monachus]|uniref:4'-phosphopantetheinyl transferase n=1 Tax=Labrys monachus TaxID=217067 RepID=A0ABU0FJX8_9HYPH|nr:4'-phosphopantetheinyl transferase superfamily protein [Labrys monachus]MDQ0394912.1 4'-phosphopantetheinyl transferase [Labrys monachus]
MKTILVCTARIDPGLELVQGRLLDLLDDAERASAARFAFEIHRRSYIAAHALKRLALSMAEPRRPADWRFDPGPWGKPRVRSVPDLHFNISHCPGLVCCAVAKTLEVGVDVEQVRLAPPFEIAPSVFSASERRWLQDLPAAERPRGFCRLWTLKEAFVKASGRGLTQQLTDFSFFFEPLRVSFCDPALGDSGKWCFHQRAADDAHFLALAWYGAADAVVEWRPVSPADLLAGA